MITWVTVWVLTVYTPSGNGKHSYQLQYAKQTTCEQQRLNHTSNRFATRCDFQQIPIAK